jgi:transcription-repair coupling factor (superfamily II helicase)
LARCAWRRLPPGTTALAVLPLDHGFTAPDVALLTEQDMLGDRLVRRQKRRKSADAFLAELATLTPGDLVVHAITVSAAMRG